MAKRETTSGAGPSQRQLRVAELIRRAVAAVLSRGEIYDPDLAHCSITVGEVRTSPDLKLAHVYVLPLGGQNAPVIVEALNRNRREIRRLVNKSITLKFSPDLRFHLDHSFDQMDATRALFEREDIRRDLE